MPSITPDFVGNTVIVMIVAYIFTLGYSIYMAILNYRQAKVKDILLKTNEILGRIEEQIRKR